MFMNRVDGKNEVSSLDSKILIDINNWLIAERFEIEPIIHSMAKDIQVDISSTHVVKAFGTLAVDIFKLPLEFLREHEVTVFVDGANATVNETVVQLAQGLGFTAPQSDRLYNARLWELVCDLIRYFIVVARLRPLAKPRSTLMCYRM